MGPKKKKSKAGPSNADRNSSDDERRSEKVGSACPHVTKALNVTLVKRNLENLSRNPTIGWGKCTLCCKAGNFSQIHDDAGNLHLGICLRCGNACCKPVDGSADHCLEHFKVPRSDSHALALMVCDWSVWCFECGKASQPPFIGKLSEVVEAVKKLVDKFNYTGSTETGKQSPEIPGEDKAGSSQGKPEEMVTTRKKDQNKSGFVESAELPEVRGLLNNGNTCFFNSTLQALSQCHFLSQILDVHLQTQKNVSIPPPTKRHVASSRRVMKAEDDFVFDDEIHFDSLEVDLPESEPLIHSLSAQFKLMLSSSALKGPVNPRILFSQLCKKAPLFEGGDQHDAQELLRQFLEQIRLEEGKRYQRAILNAFNLSPKTDPKTVSPVLKVKVNAYAKRISQNTLTDWIFGGQFINTIICEECSHSSQRVEPFLDISLPILDEKALRHGTKHDDEVEVGCLSATKKKKPEKLGVKPKGKKAREAAKKAKKEMKKKRKFNEEAEVETGPSESIQEVEEKDDGKLNESIENEPRIKEEGEGAREQEREVEAEDEEDDDDDEEDGSSKGDAADVEDNIEAPDSRCCPSPQAFSADAVSTNSGSSIDSGVSSQSTKSNQSSLESTMENAGASNILGGATSQMSHNSHDSGWGSIDMGSVERSPDTSSLLMGKHGHEEEGNAWEELETKMVQMSLEDTKEEEKARKYWLASCLASLGARKHHCSTSSSLPSSWLSSSRDSAGVSIDMLMAHFTSPEIMSGCNRFACEKCAERERGKLQTAGGSSDSDDASSGSKKKVHLSNASRQALILVPPPVLTLHLKRFEQTSSFTLRKVTKHVSFPFVLDLAPYTAYPAKYLAKEIKNSSSVNYSLFAVVEHIGTLRSGHYVAYVKVRKAESPEKLKNLLNMGLETDVDSHFQTFFSKWKESGAGTEIDAAEKTGGDFEEPFGVWYYASDSHVSKCGVDRVAKSQAYLLFYERVL